MSETSDNRGRAIAKVKPFLQELEAKPFWANLREHKLTAQQCNSCGKFFTYPPQGKIFDEAGFLELCNEAAVHKRVRFVVPHIRTLLGNVFVGRLQSLCDRVGHGDKILAIDFIRSFEELPIRGF